MGHSIVCDGKYVLALSCLEPKGPVSAEVLDKWFPHQMLRDWALNDPRLAIFNADVTRGCRQLAQQPGPPLGCTRLRGVLARVLNPVLAWTMGWVGAKLVDRF